ncbi:spore protein [Lentibacillus cibarius]|uniref:Spore protein n=1 Tax=Lentibacillus cibarius TaxID=2583219 RepID=A0A549YKZ3_9BACI|nr:spore protein [Lentibacillus cibarius]TRM12543.1 spore protein [Lentibacillus cibarius]
MKKKPSQQKTEKFHQEKHNQTRDKKLDGPNRPST